MLTVFIRALILYVALIVVIRVMGKRQLGQLQPFELVLALLLADLAATPMSDVDIPLIYGIAPILALLVVHQVISFILLKSEKARALICGRPAILIYHGKIDERELHRQTCTLNDLLEQLRQNGVTDISEVDAAVLEPSGMLSVLQSADKRPATPSDLNITVQPVSLPYTLILDGKVNRMNLHKAGKDEKWLTEKVRAQGLHGPEDVLYLLLDNTSGQMQFQAREKGKRKRRGAV